MSCSCGALLELQIHQEDLDIQATKLKDSGFWCLCDAKLKTIPFQLLFLRLRKFYSCVSVSPAEATEANLFIQSHFYPCFIYSLLILK